MGMIKAIAKSFINLIYPLHCAICKKSLDPLDEFGVCASCIGKIEPSPMPHYEGRKRLRFEKTWSACLYEGELKELIRLFKYKGRLSLSNILSKLLIGFINENPEVLDDIDAITYVPLHNRRLRKRGFNQSKVLALKVSQNFDIPLLDLLEKTRSTKAQNELSRKERLANLVGAFKIRNRAGTGKNILLIDDVMTTGATLEECAKILLGSGAKSVRCLTLARGR